MYGSSIFPFVLFSVDACLVLGLFCKSNSKTITYFENNVNCPVVMGLNEAYLLFSAAVLVDLHSSIFLYLALCLFVNNLLTDCFDDLECILSVVLI